MCVCGHALPDLQSACSILLSVCTVQMSAVSIKAQLAAERKETDKHSRYKKI